jgi:hypothetical protein
MRLVCNSGSGLRCPHCGVHMKGTFQTCEICVPYQTFRDFDVRRCLFLLMPTSNRGNSRPLASVCSITRSAKIFPYKLHLPRCQESSTGIVQHFNYEHENEALRLEPKFWTCWCVSGHSLSKIPSSNELHRYATSPQPLLHEIKTLFGSPLGCVSSALLWFLRHVYPSSCSPRYRRNVCVPHVWHPVFT